MIEVEPVMDGPDYTGVIKITFGPDQINEGSYIESDRWLDPDTVSLTEHSARVLLGRLGTSDALNCCVIAVGIHDLDAGSLLWAQWQKITFDVMPDHMRRSGSSLSRTSIAYADNGDDKPVRET